MFDWQEYNKKGWGTAFLGCSAQQDLPTHGWRLVKQMSSPLTGPLVPHGNKDLYLDVGEQPKDEAPAGVRKGFPGSPLWWQLIYPKEQQGIKKVNCQYLHTSSDSKLFVLRAPSVIKCAVSDINISLKAVFNSSIYQLQYWFCDLEATWSIKPYKLKMKSNV